MQSRIEHLRLTEKLFRDVIAHIQLRTQKLEAFHDDDDPGFYSVDEHTSSARCAVVALRLEVCLYSLCLDRVRQQMEDLEGARDAGRERARDNYYRLMSALAQSELTRDTGGRSFGLSGRDLTAQPLTDAQMFTALEGTAERQLANLLAM